MKLRHFVIVGAAMLSLSFAIGLSCDGSGKCDPASCASGCCDGDVCRPGTDALACGAHGAQCATCANGDGCEAGACTQIGNVQNPGGQGGGTGGGNPGPYTDGGWECMALGYCPRLGSDECGEPCGVGCCVPFDPLGRCNVSLLPSLCGANGDLCGACAADERCTSTAGGGACVGQAADGGAGGGGGGLDAGSLPVGSACTSNDQCAGGICELGGNFADGYCTARCAHPLTCPLGSSCSPFFGTSPEPECMADCANPGQGQDSCRVGYVCDLGWATGGTKATCAPACTGTSDCGGTRCEQGYCCGLASLRCCASGAACEAGTGCGSDGYCH